MAKKITVISIFLGNIRVFCRCRPLNADEVAEGASTAIDFESAKDGELIVRGHVSSKKVFKFDSVFSPEEDQGNIFVNASPCKFAYAFSDVTFCTYYVQKRYLRKLRHLQLPCWTDSTFAFLPTGRPALVKHIQWKASKELEGLTIEP